ncbi:MAG: hypothetical protein IKE01_03940 [Clostridia bacterium]|nr:hypothetical protein [Clostridia bacterium]
MINIEHLRMLNETEIIYNKKQKLDYQKNEIIEKLLADEAVFFKIPKEDAYLVLKKLGIPEDQLYINYISLISYDEYQRLIKSNKLTKEETILDIDNLYNTDVFRNKQTKVNDIALVPVKNKETIYEKILKIFRKLMKKRINRKRLDY